MYLDFKKLSNRMSPRKFFTLNKNFNFFYAFLNKIPE